MLSKGHKMIGKCSTPIKLIEPKNLTSLPVHPDCRVPQKCFVGNHTLSGTLDLPLGGPPVTLFEDFTCNHNKTFLRFQSVDPPASSTATQPIEVTIRTRGCNIPITNVIRQDSSRAFQVEDLESVVVSNVGTVNFAEFEFTIEKTFCICCDDEVDQNREGFIDTHTIPRMQISLPAGATQTVFEDLTCNHNKTLLALETTSTSVSATIRTRRCDTPITIRIDPTGEITPGLRVIQVEDFESLSITNLASNAGTTFNLNGQKTFCICCDGEDNDPKFESCDSTCNHCASKGKCSCSLCSRNRK